MSRSQSLNMTKIHQRRSIGCRNQAVITIISDQRILTRGRIAGRGFFIGKFNVTLDCFCGRPIGILRRNHDVIPLKSAPSRGVSGPHLKHSSLGPLESTSQTASRSVQPFLHSSRQKVVILHNGPPLFAH